MKNRWGQAKGLGAVAILWVLAMRRAYELKLWELRRGNRLEQKKKKGRARFDSLRVRPQSHS